MFDHKSREVINEFHKLFYDTGQLKLTTARQEFRDPTARWMGWAVQKCPLDLFIYQEILYQCRPELIIECGTANGGSGLFLAQMAQLMNMPTQVLTIDITSITPRPEHPNLAYLNGDTLDKKLIETLATYYNLQKVGSCMVILDDDHDGQHVYEELYIYSQFVTPGQYLIVEDTNINNHPVLPLGEGKIGPYEAVERWLPGHPEFVVDPTKEKFLMTYNPRGYLLRIGINHQEIKSIGQ